MMDHFKFKRNSNNYKMTNISNIYKIILRSIQLQIRLLYFFQI